MARVERKQKLKEDRIISETYLGSRIISSLNINFQRGLFRLWLTASIGFGLFIGLLYEGNLRKDFHAYWALQRNRTFATKTSKDVFIPRACDGVLGQEDKDYFKDREGYFCWFPVEKYWALYPDTQFLNERTLAEKAFTEIEASPIYPRPWSRLLEALGLVIGVPISVLFLAFVLKWIVSGFTRDIP